MNTDKLKQMYASGGLLRAILKDPKMRQMASEMLSSEGKEYGEGGIGPNKNTDGGIGPRKKRKAAEAARKAQFEEQLANATIPLWERESMLRERLRFLHAEMKKLSEKEGISMDDAYVRYNEDNWAEDPRYEERMARIKAAKGGDGMMEIEDVGFYEEGGMMEYEEGDPVKPKYAGKNEWAMSPHGVAFIAAEMDDRGIGFRSDETTKVLQGIMASDPDFAAQIIDNAFARAADESRNRYSTNTFTIGGYGQNQQVGNVPGYRTTINKPSGYRM
jgi:hypothetical protein